MENHIWEALIVLAGAQVSLLTYLNQRRIENAERRFLNECLDPFVRDFADAAVLEISKVTLARRLLSLAADGVLDENAICAARQQMPQSRSLFGVPYFRLAGLVRDVSFFVPLQTAMKIVGSNDDLLGERLLLRLRALNACADDSKRGDLARFLDRALETQREMLAGAASGIPLVLGEMANGYSALIHAEPLLDFADTSSQMTRLARSLAPQLKSIEADLQRKSSQVRKQMETYYSG